MSELGKTRKWYKGNLYIIIGQYNSLCYLYRIKAIYSDSEEIITDKEWDNLPLEHEEEKAKEQMNNIEIKDGDKDIPPHTEVVRELFIEFNSGATKTFENVLSFKFKKKWLHIKMMKNENEKVLVRNIALISTKEIK